MAKDVNLSSKEWLDIVFEGKNKEYGAYQMRADSVRRHTKSVIIVIVILALVFVGLLLAISGVFTSAEEDTNAGIEQEQFATYDADEEDQEEEDVIIPEEEEKPQIPEEDLVAQIQNTAIDIVDDNEVVNKAVEQEELRETDAMSGSMNIESDISDLAKETVKQEVVIETKVEEKPKDDIVYNTANVQQQPEFPGGEAAMYKWLSEHIQYPAAAAEEGVAGRVTVEFIVSKTGAIENARVVRGRHPALDKEALRVVKSMPNWNPGRNNGQAVKVTYILPVTFKLQN